MSDSRNSLSSLGGGTAPTPPDNPAAPAAPRSAPPASAPASRPAPPPSAGPALRPQGAAPQPRYVEPEPARRPPTLLFSGVGVLLALGSGTAFLLKPPAPAVVPAAYTSFAAPDGVFQCQVPNGWSKQPMGELAGEDRVNVDNGIVMQSGSARVEVTLSKAGALALGQLLFGKETVPESVMRGRAIGVDRLHRPSVKKQYAEYREKKQAECPSEMGGFLIGDNHKIKPDAVLYEFTGKSGLLVKRTPTHGYRAVVAGPDLIASVEARCSEADWPKMKPVFRHIIKNLREVHPETDEERELKQMLKQMEGMTPPPQGG